MKNRKIGGKVNKYQHYENNMESIGCHTCHYKPVCGGLRTNPGIVTCLDFCCGKHESCECHCLSNAKFVDDIKEIDGYELRNIPRSLQLQKVELPCYVPIVYDRSSRQQNVPSNFVALPLKLLFNKKTETPRFVSRAELCDRLKVDYSSNIVISGIADDYEIEAWWKLGSKKRRSAVKTFREIGIKFVTSPNYSVISNRPRFGDLDAMKRIAIVQHEFQSEGIVCALHVNGRTDRDFDRWAEYLNLRTEISNIAFEFSTGAKYGARRETYIRWLLKLAKVVERPLHITITGITNVIPDLAAAFEGVTYLDSSAIMKSKKRKMATLKGNKDLEWHHAPTEVGTPIDDLFQHNLNERRSQITVLSAPPLLQTLKSA
jgi:hypothetical protein